MKAEEYTRRLAAGLKPDTGTVFDPKDGSVPVYFPGPGETDAPGDDDDIDLEDLTPEQEAALEADLVRREGVENALLNAEEVAKANGEKVLGDCLARLSFFWDLGVELHAFRILDKVTEQIRTSLRARLPVDDEGKEE